MKRIRPRVLALLALGPHATFAAMTFYYPQGIDEQGGFLLVGFIASFALLQAINACDAFDDALNALPFINANHCPTIALMPAAEEQPKHVKRTERPHLILSLLIGLTAGWACSGLALLSAYVPLSHFTSKEEAAVLAYGASLAALFASMAWTASLIDTVTMEGGDPH